MARKYGLYINGQYVHTRSWRPVPKSTAPTELLGEIALYDSQQDDPEILDAALEGLSQTFEQIRSGDFFPLPERLAFLARLRQRLEDQKENLAQLMMHEVAKPIALCRAEIERARETLHWTIKDAETTLAPRKLLLEGRAGWNEWQGHAVREPRGPLLALSPFNFPVNLVMHKIAPAIASGCPVLLKPSSKAALTALCLVDFCHAEGLPPGMLNLFSCVDRDVATLVTDARLRHISFTGSSNVGWNLRKLTSKPFTLELGGAAPSYVGPGTNLEFAAQVLAQSAVAYAGQSCISAQSIHIETSLYKKFVEHFEKCWAEIEWGSPANDKTLCGPVIDTAARERLDALKERLRTSGACVVETPRAPLNAESPSEHLVRPAFIVDLDAADAFWGEECFGPLVALRPVTSLSEFVSLANALPQRLQASIWGSPSDAALAKASRELDFGGVVINHAPSSRFDGMPYGGRGEAGTGREGPRYALEEFTDWKSVLSKS